MESLNKEYARKPLFEVIWQSGAILALALALSFSVNHLRKDGLPVVGDWSPKARLSTLNTAEDPVVTIEEARALFMTNGAIFIDSRPREAYLAGHIEGALNLPSDSFEEYFPRVMADVPPDTLLITYCDGETCALSKEVALGLAGNGYSHTRVLVNGWSVWQDANLPVRTGEN